MKTKLTMLLVALAALSALAFSGPWRAQAAVNTLIVDDNLVAPCPGATYTSIQAAVTAASPGDIIQVCPGTYNENVLISKALTLNGAQAGNSVALVGGRLFGSGSESTVNGKITIAAADVTIDGFSLTNPGQDVGILIKTAGDNAVIQNNIIDTIGSNALTTPAQAIYLENGPDDVSILCNRITNVQSLQQSAKGIYIGDSTASDPSTGILIQGNSISNIKSGWRGAYGIQANNGVSLAPTATGYTEVEILDNTISDLAGGINPDPLNPNRGWAHAIGLEGDTPGVVVVGNSISNVVDANPTPIADAVAVLFEDNPSFYTGKVNKNNFDAVFAGIVVKTPPSTNVVDGTSNWWGSPTGPTSPDNPGGTGAVVSPNVNFTPWLTAPVPTADFDNDGIADACDALTGPPQTAAQCKNGGWQRFNHPRTFKNQGDCIQFVNTGK